MRRNIYLPILLVMFACAVLAERRGPVAQWSFDGAQEASEIRGFSTIVPGVSGNALRFDGQTTTVITKASAVGRFGPAFTVEAWVAIQEYPWTWCAIVNQEKAHRAGYFFGVEPEGRFGLHIAAGGTWQISQSDIKLPLYTWNHLAATFDPATGIRLYCNGKLVGQKRVAGTPRFAPAVDAWLGRNHTPLGLSHEVKVVAPVAFSFNGLIDEVRIHDAAEPASESRPPLPGWCLRGPAPLAPPVLPAGPAGPGRFGAYYARLKYAEEWERPWRVGDTADVVVRFDETANRLVFWRGTSYIPAWVTENGIWYTNEFYETQSDPMTISSEPMADKQARVSHAEDCREQRRPCRRRVALRAGHRELRPGARRSPHRVGRLGRGDLHRVSRRHVRAEDPRVVVHADGSYRERGRGPTASDSTTRRSSSTRRERGPRTTSGLTR